MGPKSRRLAVGTAFALLVVVFGREVDRPAWAANELAVTIEGNVDARAYPQMEATVSVIDPATGRPVSNLLPENFSVSDDSGAARVVSATADVSSTAPTAYVLLVDTSAAMATVRPDGKTNMQRTTEVIRDFASKLGKDDQVRLLAFNAGTDTFRTNWERRGDPNLDAAIAALQPTTNVGVLAPALVEAANIAGAPPPGLSRRAVLVFTNIQNKPVEPELKLENLQASLRSTFFTFGVGTATENDQRLTVFLDDLAKATGGGYWGIDGPPAPAEALRLLFGITQRTWRLGFATDGLPDGANHDLTVTVRDASQRSGQAKVPYRSGNLRQVSPVVFENIARGDSLTGDRDIQVKLGGTRQWERYRLELFKDCEPGTCSPVASSTDRDLAYRIAVGGMDQGDHYLRARITVTDGPREFSNVEGLTFVRSGTTWNWSALVLIGGLAIVSIVIAVIVMRRHSADVIRPPSRSSL